MIYYLNWFLIAVIATPIFYQLYQSRWESIDYTHAYFILPLSLWVTWQKRRSLKELAIKNIPHPSDYWGLLMFVLGLFLFVFGWREGFLLISSFSLIPIAWGITRFLYGSAVVKSLSFPIFYLLFLIPPPLGILDAVTLPMRYWISSIAKTLLSMLGYPITKSGLLLTIGGHEVFMGAPCSGFRSLITMFALAVAYVYFIKSDFKKALILIPSVIPFALFGNLVRVMGLCLVTYYAGNEAAEGFFHDFSGGLIFLVMISCLLGFEHLIDKAQKKRRHP